MPALAGEWEVRLHGGARGVPRLPGLPPRIVPRVTRRVVCPCGCGTGAQGIWSSAGGRAARGCRRAARTQEAEARGGGGGGVAWVLQRRPLVLVWTSSGYGTGTELTPVATSVPHGACAACQVSVAVEAQRRAGLPFVSVLADPTYGGVSASYAMQADVRIGVAKARIGFAGPDVILNTMFETNQAEYDKACPNVFQSSE